MPILEKTNSRRQITVERDQRNEVSRNRTVWAFLRLIFAQLDHPPEDAAVFASSWSGYPLPGIRFCRRPKTDNFFRCFPASSAALSRNSPCGPAPSFHPRGIPPRGAGTCRQIG